MSLPTKEVRINQVPFLEGDYQAFRGISENTCKVYDYQTSQYQNQTCQIANYFDHNQNLLTQQIRYVAKKEFEWRNYSPSIGLFGDHIPWDYTKEIYITEGQIDALSLYECGFQAMSIRGGIQTALTSLEAVKSELLKFKKIILWFDSTDHGPATTQKCLKLFPLGLVGWITSISKDANEALQKGTLVQEIAQVIEYCPANIIFGSKLDSKEFLKPLPEGLLTGRKNFDRMTRGYNFGQLYLFLGGSGIGKSTIIRNDVFLLHQRYNIKIANYFLEETNRTTPLSYVAMDLGIPTGDFLVNPLKYTTKENFERSWQKVIVSGNMVFQQLNSGVGSQEFLHQVEYLVSTQNIKLVVLDHIQLLISNNEDQNERRALDHFMDSFHKLILKYQFIGIIACQLSNPDKGDDWTDGREVKQSDARGSASLRYKPDVMIGIERNLTFNSDKMYLRVVKNRYFGYTGLTDEIRFIENTGKLIVLNE